MIFTSSKTIISNESTPLGKGGEGIVYKILSPSIFRNQVAKILHSDKRDRHRKIKLEYLINNPPALQDNDSVIWPKELLFDDQGFIGFTMPTSVKGIELLKIISDSHLKKMGNDWHRLRLETDGSALLRVKLCYNIAAALTQIYAVGKYVLVDLKPDNILVSPDLHISIIDIDSCQVIENNTVLFHSQVCTQEYAPPESSIIDVKKNKVSEYWDRFSIAVIFYEILFGIKPYVGTLKPPYENFTISESIKGGFFVFGSRRSSYAVIPPPHNEFSVYPDDIQQYFIKAFDLGNSHPQLRPTVDDWARIFDKYCDNLPLKKIITKPVFSQKNVPTTISNISNNFPVQNNNAITNFGRNIGIQNQPVSTPNIIGNSSRSSIYSVLIGLLAGVLIILIMYYLYISTTSNTINQNNKSQSQINALVKVKPKKYKRKTQQNITIEKNSIIDTTPLQTTTPANDPANIESQSIVNSEPVIHDFAKIIIRSDYDSEKDLSALEKEVGNDPLKIDFFDFRLIRKRLKYLMEEDFNQISFFRKQSRDAEPIEKVDKYLRCIYNLPNQPYIAILYIDLSANEFVIFVCNGFQKNLIIYSEKQTIPSIILKSAVDRLNRQTLSKYKYEVFDNSIVIKNTAN